VVAIYLPIYRVSTGYNRGVLSPKLWYRTKSWIKVNSYTYMYTALYKQNDTVKQKSFKYETLIITLSFLHMYVRYVMT